jgi:hypothetical protein
MTCEALARLRFGRRKFTARLTAPAGPREPAFCHLMPAGPTLTSGARSPRPAAASATVRCC